MDNPLSPTDEGMPTRVRLIGPFDNDGAAAAWGTDPQNNPHDNPCWQVVSLVSTDIHVIEPA